MSEREETTQAILDKGANYILGLKSNRFAMYDDTLLFLDDPALVVDDEVTTTDADHGRLEMRRLRITYDVAWLAAQSAFPGLQGLADLIGAREKSDGKVETSRRLYLRSRKMPTAQALAAIRAHWTIENQLHFSSRRRLRRRSFARKARQRPAQSRCPAPDRPQSRPSG